MCLKMQRELLTSDDGRLLVCILYWTGVLPLMPTYMNLLTFCPSYVLSFKPSVSLNTISLGGQTLSYMKVILCE